MTTQKHDFSAAPVQIEELPPMARFSLRLRPARRMVLAEAIGVDLPVKIGDRARTGTREVLCLGPDEWLIVTTPDDAGALSRAAATAYARAPHSLCEISDREITLRLSGPQVLDLLATGCPRDIEGLAEGRAVRTLFDSATVVLWRDGPSEFRMDIWRSFLPHVRALLNLAQDELQTGL